MNLFLLAFLLLAPGLLAAKAVGKWRTSTWWILLVCIVTGWGLVNFAIWSHFEELARVAAMPGASDEAMEAAQNDGAARVFGLLFGWAYAAIYFGVWLLLFRAYNFFRTRLGKVSRQPEST